MKIIIKNHNELQLVYYTSILCSKKQSHNRQYLILSVSLTFSLSPSPLSPFLSFSLFLSLILSLSLFFLNLCDFNNLFKLTIGLITN